MQAKNILALVLVISITGESIASDELIKQATIDLDKITNEFNGKLEELETKPVSKINFELVIRRLMLVQERLVDIALTVKHDHGNADAIARDINNPIEDTARALFQHSLKSSELKRAIEECKEVKTEISNIQTSDQTVKAMQNIALKIINTILIPVLELHYDDVTKSSKQTTSKASTTKQASTEKKPSKNDQNDVALKIMINRIKDFNNKTKAQRNKGILSPDFAALKKLNSDVNDAVSAIAGTSEIVKTVNTYTANELIPYLEKAYKQVDQLNSDLEKYKQKKTSLTTKIKNLFKAEDEKIQTTSKEEKNEIKTKLSEKASSLTRTITDLEGVGKKFLTEQDTLKNKLKKMSGNIVVAYGLEQEFLTTCYNFTTNAIADVYNVQQKIQNM